MKTDTTRLTITRQKGQALGEHHGDMKLAQSQLVGAKKATTRAQAAAELASFKRNISKLSTRQLQGLHARLKARLGKVALAKLMRGAK
jgi:hypothetical protein